MIETDMAKTDNTDENILVPSEKISISEFRINGLFGYLDHIIPFPEINPSNLRPNILIIEGQNGTGKTTILKMIAGMINLNFDDFRKIPFTTSSLRLSNGDCLTVTFNPNDPLFPIDVTFGRHKVSLIKER